MYQQFNTLGDHPHIPQEAFLYVPHRGTSSESRDDFRIGDGKGIRRLLFEGWAEQTYTDYELQKLKQFEEYVQRKGAKLDERWDKSWKMRFLLSTGCNNKKCIADMETFINYRNTVKELSFTKNVAKNMRNGVFYITGRDCHYRPILVFDVAKIISSGMSEDELLQAQTYFMQYVIRNFLIPGQVQNWVVIIDVADTGLFSLVSAMKKSFTFLSETYRSRMFVCYVVRIPTSISFIWAVVKKFLEEETVRKINFFDQMTIEPLLEYCNPSQLQRKFGGTLQNVGEGHFWPPREVSTQYKCAKEPTKLLTKQEYTEYYNKKTLYNTKFHEENILRAASTELRENINHTIIKRIEKEFKIELQMSVEDTVSVEKDIKPYSQIKAPLNFMGMLAKNKTSKRESVPTQ